MKISHNTPPSGFRSAVVTPEYQREVDRSTDRAFTAYERARRRAEAAERRLERARSVHERKATRQSARDLAVADELNELRRAELLRIEALMKSSPASAEHRGTRSFRPVPTPGRAI